MQGKGLIGEREEDKRKRESKEFFLFYFFKFLLLLTEGMGMDWMLNVFYFCIGKYHWILSYFNIK